MAKKTKESHPFSIRMEKAIFDRMNRFCQKNHMSKTAVAEIGITMFIDDFESKMKRLNEKSK